MRDVWALRKGGSPEYAQALFEKAGEWLDCWQDARADSRALSRAGVRVHAHARRDTWRSHLARAEGGIETGIKADALPEGEITQTAILAIYAAHQAILTGWRDSWALAMELSAAAQKSFGDRVIPARVESNKRLNGANAERSLAGKARDAEMLAKARELLERGTNRRALASILARQKWPDALNPRSEAKVMLTTDQVRRLLKRLLDK